VPRRSPLPGAALVVGALTLALACGSIREDQLECEEAVTKLVQCCTSSFDPSPIQCTYTSGCGTTYPDLDIPTSQCIRSETCGELFTSDVCTRALASHPMGTSDDGETGAATPGVCP
jgi:hypothetical protein